MAYTYITYTTPGTYTFAMPAYATNLVYLYLFVMGASGGGGSAGNSAGSGGRGGTTSLSWNGGTYYISCSGGFGGAGASYVNSSTNVFGAGGAGGTLSTNLPAGSSTSSYAQGTPGASFPDGTGQSGNNGTGAFAGGDGGWCRTPDTVYNTPGTAGLGAGAGTGNGSAGGYKNYTPIDSWINVPARIGGGGGGGSYTPGPVKLYGGGGGGGAIYADWWYVNSYPISAGDTVTVTIGSGGSGSSAASASRNGGAGYDGGVYIAYFPKPPSGMLSMFY